MPVKIGDNLTLEENKLSAVYKELYTKLNKACAWTHTETTTSGGTASIICNGQIINTLQTSGNIIFPDVNAYNSCIIDGKVYYVYQGNFIRIGSFENIKEIYKYYGSYAIFTDENNNIYQWTTDSTTSSQYRVINNIENYDFVGGATSWGTYPIYISNGKLYFHNKTQFATTLTKCQQSFLSGGSATTATGFVINDGYLYYINNSNISLVGNSNNWVKFLDGSVSGYYDVDYILIINRNKEIYRINASKLSNPIKIIFPVSDNKIKKFQGTLILTTDGEIYYNGNISSSNWTKIVSSYIWDDVSRFNDYYGYGISEGKLYSIKFSSSSYSSPTITRIGSGTGYTKIDGMGYYTSSITSNSSMAVAYTGDSLIVENTVFTTKNPISSDDAYFNTNDFTNHSTISSVTSNTITDQYRTYTRDTSKDSSFINIPAASMHETITAIDLLAATNPSN